MPHPAVAVHRKGCNVPTMSHDRNGFISFHCQARHVRALPFSAHLSLPKNPPFSSNMVATASRTVFAASTAAPTSASMDSDLAQAYLQDFLGWLIANGVEGIGTTDSKIALFNGEGGERGIAAIAPLRRGDTFARIPLRLAITDDPEDEESNALVGADAPWSVRLVCKVLRMASAGDESPWAPYLKVLPTAVPNPLSTFSWEDTQAIAYEPARRQLDHAAWLAASSLDSLPDGAAGPAPLLSRESFEWALSVVHSRTFGSAGRTGGVGVRMLVPLVDMLNHAGDEDRSTTAGPAAVPMPVAVDNVRWDIVSKIGGEYFMVLTATRDIIAGEELLLSYGERSNDDFFMHYGFIPSRNVHDDVILFCTIEEAIDWHLEKYVPIGGLPPSQLQAVINAAYAAAGKEEAEAAGGNAAAMEAALEALPEVEAEKIRAERAAIKLLSRKRTDGRLIAALEILHAAAVVGGGPVAKNFEDHIREAVGARAVEVLRSMHRMSGMRLEEDLALLAKVESELGSEDGFGAAAAVYCPAIAGSSWAEAVYQSPDAATADVAGEGTVLSSTGTADSTSGTGTGTAEESSTFSSTFRPSVVVDTGAGVQNEDSADAALLAALQRAAPPGFFLSSEGSSSSTDQEERNKSAGNVLTASRILALKYRANKAMILWDALL